MPQLDVSDVLLDPMFAQTLNVTRRSQTVDSSGRTVITTATLNPIGVVINGPLQDNPQEADYQHASSWINVHCVVRLLDNASGFQPDLIVYKNQTWIVRRAFDYSEYGAGFYAAECELQDLNSEAP